MKLLKNIPSQIPFALSFSLGLFALSLAHRTYAASNVQELICSASRIINQLITVVAAIALLTFFWGLVKFISNAGDEEGRKKGKQVMVWGIIALFVMLSILGIIFFLQQSIFGAVGDALGELPDPCTGAPAEGG